MNTPTYEQQWQKITEAYMRDEIKPYNSTFCFCGTLCDKSSKWYGDVMTYHHSQNGYEGNDFVKMETALLTVINNRLKLSLFSNFIDVDGIIKRYFEHPDYESALFLGMTEALEVLRQIHAERCDVTAIEIPLVKRSLNPVI